MNSDQPIRFKEGAVIDLGTASLSEEEIIAFATQFDPLEFHTDKEFALKGHFKGIIASGPHIFNVVHKNKWIPLFGKTVIAGLGINHWKFIKPIYPEQKIRGTVTILSIKENPEKRHATITWLYEFKDEKGEMVQSLEMIVLHKISYE